MDLTFRAEDGVFNYRVCAVIKYDNKLLAMKNERTPYYYLPGGRVMLHESAEAAIVRELKEELDIDANVVRLLWFAQSFSLRTQLTKSSTSCVRITSLMCPTQTSSTSSGLPLLRAITRFFNGSILTLCKSSTFIRCSSKSE